MKYLLDKDSIGKLALEVFGPERCWVQTEHVPREIRNPEWDENDYFDDPDDYDVPKYIMGEVEKIKIHIHFPELKITNSRSEEHTIYDLFTRFTILIDNPNGGEHDYKLNINFSGRRTTYTYNEMYSNYGHSHLNSSFGFHNFCTGSSYYNTLLTEIQLSPTEENWLMLFMGLEKFVSWESIEGGPYRYIKEIKGPTSKVEEYELQAELEKMLPLIPKSAWSYTTGLTLIENHPSLYQVFNEYSSIRRISISANPVKEKRNIKDWESQYREYGFTWKEGQEGEQYFPINIIANSSQETPQIAQEVVDKYITIIKRQIEQYNQNLSYERAKELWLPKTIAKAGIIK